MNDSHVRVPYRSIHRRLMGVEVLATGSYVPDPVVDNHQLAARLGFDSDWILQRTGIRQRRHCPPEMATSDMGYEAARRCLDNAGVAPNEVDLLLVATATPDVGAVSTACLVQNRLGLIAPAADMMNACAGFVYALVTGMQYVATGCARRALVVGADTMSRVLNPMDQRTYPLFGDGAGAVLLGPGQPHQGLEAYTLGSDGSGAEMLIRRMGGSRFPPSVALMEHNEHYLDMDGKAVFKWAVKLFNDTVPPLLMAAGVTTEEIDLWVLHQANLRIISAVAKDLAIDSDKFVVNLDRYGNTTAGSIPLALDEAVSQGRVARGDRLLLSGFGAGLAWGTAVLRW